MPSIQTLFDGGWSSMYFRPFQYRIVCARYLRGIGSVCLLLAGLLLFSTAESATSIVIMDFELNDLTLNPNIAEETERTETLRPLLAEELASAHGMQVVTNPDSARTEAAKGKGYLFDRPAVVARIGQEAGVDWAVSGRLHKASFLFVYLKAQLINTETAKVAADFVVEVKGPQKKLTLKGVETLGVQISEAIMTIDKGL